jgi:hypothetical protein
MHGLAVRQIRMNPKPITLLQSGHLSNRESLTFPLHAHFNLRTYQVEGSGVGRRSVCYEQAREYDGEERNPATSEVFTERGQMFETSNGERMRSDSFQPRTSILYVCGRFDPLYRGLPLRNFRVGGRRENGERYAIATNSAVARFPACSR